jgi:hypothetical protein
MRSKKATRLCGATFLLILWIGCASQTDEERPPVFPNDPVVPDESGRTPVAPKVEPSDPKAGCAADADCSTGFCDRGTCAMPSHSEMSNYGRDCEPLLPEPKPTKPLPPIRPEDIRMPTGPVNVCGGFRCIDHRCRSCLSDAECRTWNPTYTEGPLTCKRVEGRGGKTCGRYDREPKDINRPPPLPPEFPKPPKSL